MITPPRKVPDRVAQTHLLSISMWRDLHLELPPTDISTISVGESPRKSLRCLLFMRLFALIPLVQ